MGCFNMPEEAGAAYDAKAVEIHGRLGELLCYNMPICCLNRLLTSVWATSIRLMRQGQLKTPGGVDTRQAG
jgi:hypothetical protein